MNMNLARVLRSPRCDFRSSMSLYYCGRSTPCFGSKRFYALSRFSEKIPGARRARPSQRPPAGAAVRKVDEISPAVEAFNNPSTTLVADDDGLRKLLFHGDTVTVERQIEMLNVLAGFEQSNKYTISGADGETLGFIAEDPKGLLGTLARQALRTHRPFRAVVTDNGGKPLLFLRRPFSWINSKMFVQRKKDHSGLSSDPGLETFGEVQQEWHLWRRRYDLFLRELVVSGAAADASGVEETERMFYQVARVDAGFLAWKFALQNANGDEIASMVRTFRGFGHEIFLDTGRYSVNFTPRKLLDDQPLQDVPATKQAAVVRELSLDERALFLALAVNIDFDYFSRHSHVGGGGLFHIPYWD